jgi:hypothetical protein
MTQKTGIIVDILTEFKGANKLKEAEKGFASLGNAIKKLAVGFTVEQLVTRSIDAFKSEQLAVTALSNSLANLGVTYDSISPVIDKQAESFVNLGFKTSDTIQSINLLTTALQNPAKALDVLNTTADLARYKNKSLSETASLVAKAVAGNSRAFSDLGLKIDTTLTPQNAFNKLLEQADAKVKGLAKSYSKTFAGSLDVVAAKSEAASAKLGKGLAPAIQKLAEFALTYLVPIIDTLSNNIEPIIAMAGAIGAVTLAVKALGVASAISAGEMALNPVFAAAGILGGIAALTAKTANSKNPKGSIYIPYGKGGGAYRFPGNTLPTSNKAEEAKKTTTAEGILAAFEKKWNADSLAASKAQLKVQQDKLALDKAALALKQASKVLDLTQIEIFAAMQKASGDDLNRLKLQQAILDGNAVSATALANKVLQTNGLVMDLQGNIKVDPFAQWINSLTAALDNLKKIQATVSAIQVPTGAAAAAAMPTYTPLSSDSISAIASNINYQSVGGNALINAIINQQATEVKVTVDPAAMAYGISLANQNQSSNGTQTTLSRNNPGYFIPQS